jgi:hypothetical protein
MVGLPLLESLICHGLCGISTGWECREKSVGASGFLFGISETLAPGALREMISSHCTKCGHGPVDGLHTIENKSDKGANFSLTAELKGVQQNRSLTVS